MKKIIISFLWIFVSVSGFTQVTCQPTSSDGSGYLAFSFAGFGIENPDCQHPEFGAHITQVFDQELQRNVFIFHSHSTDDSDRCIHLDRVRVEAKGGPDTNAGLQHPEHTSSYYRWKFRLSEDFIGANSFSHLFQTKAYGGEDTGYPILTLTARQDRIEFKQNGGTDGITLGVLATADLDLFLGKWVEVYVEQKHEDQGVLVLEIRDVNSGSILLEYTNDNIDLWRTGAAYNRPKFGVYRKKNDDIKDEEVRFSDLCISEADSLQCPSEAGMTVANELLNIVSFIRLSPNPAKGQICVEMKQDLKAMAKIFASSGKQVGRDINLQGKTYVDLSDYCEGLYYLQVFHKNVLLVTKQFVVQ